MNPGSGGVQHEFADRYAHAPRTLVPQSQDTLVVGDDDQTHIAMAGVAQPIRNVTTVVRTKKQTAWPSQDVAEPLAGQADRGCVDDGRQTLHVLNHEAVEQCFVAVQQCNQTDVLFKRICLLENLLHLHLDLLFDGEDGLREQPLDTQQLALGMGEGGITVPHRVTQNPFAVGGAKWKAGGVVHGSSVLRATFSHIR